MHKIVTSYCSIIIRQRNLNHVNDVWKSFIWLRFLCLIKLDMMRWGDARSVIWIQSVLAMSVQSAMLFSAIRCLITKLSLLLQTTELLVFLNNICFIMTLESLCHREKPYSFLLSFNWCSKVDFTHVNMMCRSHVYMSEINFATSVKWNTEIKAENHMASVHGRVILKSW